MDLRVVLLPDKENAELICNYIRQLPNQYPTHFTLGTENFPHITLLHIQCANDEFGKIKQTISSIVGKYCVIRVNIKTIASAPEDKTYIGFYFENTTEIESLRQEIYEYITPYIDQSSSFKIPHITLTRFINEEDSQKAITSLNTCNLKKIIFPKIAISISGEHGVCKDIIYEKELINI